MNFFTDSLSTWSGEKINEFNVNKGKKYDEATKKSSKEKIKNKKYR